MNDPTTPTDEDLSAAIDGEADDTVVARIAASPAASARQAELQGAADRVAASSVPPLDPDTVDRLIGEALDTPLAPVRAERRPRKLAPIAVAAAVIVLMAIGLTLIWAGRGVESDQASSTAKSDQVASTIAPESALAADAGGSSAPKPSAGTGSASTSKSGSTSDYTVSGVQFLGSFPSGAKLREATAVSLDKATALQDIARANGTADTSTKVPTDKALSRCADQLQVTLSMKAGPTATAYALVDGDLTLVYEFASTSAKDGTPTTLVAAVGATACDPVIIFER